MRKSRCDVKVGSTDHDVLELADRLRIEQAPRSQMLACSQKSLRGPVEYYSIFAVGDIVALLSNYWAPFIHSNAP